MNRFASLVALLFAACSSGDIGPTGQVRIGLDGVPENVSSVIIWVESRGVVVASATIAPSRSGSAASAPENVSFELGVPAEQPLAFRVLAKTDRPGPQAFGGAMPGYVGTVVRTIPLGQGQVVLPITVQPAGVLTIMPRLDPALDDELLSRLRQELERGLQVELVREDGAESVLPLTLSDRASSVALRTGRYSIQALEGSDQSELAQLLGGRGLFVGREQESVASIVVSEKRALPQPEEARSLGLVSLDEQGEPLEVQDVVRTSSGAGALSLRLEAFDQSQQSVDAAAEVELRISSVPEGLVPLGPAGLAEAVRLPANFQLEVLGEGRLLIEARARFSDEGRARVLLLTSSMNVLAAGELPGPATTLELSFGELEPNALLIGTPLRVALIDGRQRFAQEQTGALDLSASDPWIFFEDGPSAVLALDDRGYIERRVALSARPPGLPVVLKATLTSSTVGTLTSSVTLPAFEELR